jgi:DNA-binding MarR family transcriptional regulator
MGYIHIRPDWDDGRSKQVSISKAGKIARDSAVSAIEPIIGELMTVLGSKKAKALIPFLRDLRILLNSAK